MKSTYLASDHAGFKLKEKLKPWLKKHRIPYEDLGAYTLIPDDDYPDYAAMVARRVARTGSKGILVCGSAQGVCIAANKIKGIRAVVPFSVKEAQLTRKHEDANILCLSGWFFSPGQAMKFILAFLNTPFSGLARHVRRVKKIKRLE